MYDVEIFPTGPMIFNEDGFDPSKQIECRNLEKKCKVLVNIEWIDDLTCVSTYKYETRIYVSDVYEMLGLGPSMHAKNYWVVDDYGKVIDFGHD